MPMTFRITLQSVPLRYCMYYNTDCGIRNSGVELDQFNICWPLSSSNNILRLYVQGVLEKWMRTYWAEVYTYWLEKVDLIVYVLQVTK